MSERDRHPSATVKPDELPSGWFRRPSFHSLDKQKEVTPKWPGCGLPPAPQAPPRPPVDASSWVLPELWGPLRDSTASGALLQGWRSGPGPRRELPPTAGDEGACTGANSVTLGKHGRTLNKGQECFVPSVLCPSLTECPWHVCVQCAASGGALLLRQAGAAQQASPTSLS